jgi:hypothetical protein
MVFALLALLGVDLIVIAVLVLAQIGRRRWLARRGAFPARVWLVQGNSDELSEKKKMGRARWIKNVLVFSRAPFFLSNNILLIEGVQGVPRPAVPGEVKRLGSDPVILLLVTDGVTVALAAPGEHGQDAIAPFETVANG